MNNLNCYDLDGNKITIDQFIEFQKDNPDYTRVALDKFDGYTVSTVLLPFDHNYGDGHPLIFETMIFSDQDEDLDERMWRYSTKEEALAGHQKAVELCKK